MVFTPATLFKGIVCPYASQCTITNCIFSHDRPAKNEESSDAGVSETNQEVSPPPFRLSGEPALKRRKITYDRLEDKPPSRADQIRSELAASRSTTLKSSGVDIAPETSSKSSTLRPGQSLPSLSKPVTPPPTNGKKASQASHASSNTHRAENGSLMNTQSSNSIPEPKAKEGLNPRLLRNDPAGHTKRSLYLKHLHAEMVRLNKSLTDTLSEQDKLSTMLTEQQLIKMALDEEERIAKEQPLVYSNIVKQRIALYKKMKPEGWRKHVETVLELENLKQPNGTKQVNTGLSSDQELLIIPYLIANQSGLEKFGYVTSPPTDVQINEATAAVEASKNFEVCDRCSARFQVWPDRSAEGRLTSNGPCRHHPNKKVIPHKTRGDVVSGLPREPYYPCCNSVVGSPGCTLQDDHVFKTNSAARLAATLPFIKTPENDKPAFDKHGQAVKAVTFDCEMGYTTKGLELIRLTAVSWPSAEELVDVLVRPLGTIIDLNSRFSGVWPESFSDAIPYSQYKASSSNAAFTANGNQANSPLPIVENPQRARELLCSFLTPKTPLIGHAIDNDLNSVRLCHPSIVDTILLYPHPRGLPLRYGLKMLSSTHLGRNIQMGGDRGHDSLEDAQATGDLVRFKIGERWKVLRSSGWRMENNRVLPPAHLRTSGEDGEATDQSNDGTVAGMVAKIFEDQAGGKKRRKKQAGSGAGETTEEEELPLGSGVAAYLRYATESQPKNT